MYQKSTVIWNKRENGEENLLFVCVARGFFFDQKGVESVEC